MNEKQLIINTMDEAKYRELSRKGRIRGDELNIVDDDSKNRTTIPSYDLFETVSQSLSTAITVTGIDNLTLAYDADSCLITLYGLDKETPITQISANDFVVDQFLESAEYVDPNLVLKVKLASGEVKTIEVPLNIQSVLSAIEAERNRAISAESELRISADTTAQAIETEQTRAIGIEKTLSNSIILNSDNITAETNRATMVESDLAGKIESIQNEKTDRTELSAFYTKSEADGKFLTEHQDISGKADLSALDSKLDKSDASVVKYTPFPSETHPDRKVIILNNHDEITGTLKDGSDGVNLVMLSKWDIADFGSNKVHLNLNSKDTVTINDSLSVLTNEDKTEIKNELQNKTDKTDFETAKDDLNGRVDDLDTKTSDRERELADEIASVSSKMPELQDAIDSEVGRAKSVERELGDKVESIQNEKADKTTLDSYYTKDEADGKFLTEHQDISGKADKAEVEESLAGKIDKTDESIVRFQPNEQTAGRKKISLNNYDNIVGKAIDGTEYNLAMISKWDVADFGSTGVHMNLNTNDIVTINDTLSVLTTTDKNEIATDISQKISALEAKLSVEYVKRSDYDTLLSRVNDLETRLQNIEILLDPTWRATTINTETAINTDKASAETINLI